MEISPRAHANLDRVSSATVSELHPLLGLLRRVLASPSFSVSFFFERRVACFYYVEKSYVLYTYRAERNELCPVRIRHRIVLVDINCLNMNDDDRASIIF
jgi:hypothetical protein